MSTNSEGEGDTDAGTESDSSTIADAETEDDGAGVDTGSNSDTDHTIPPAFRKYGDQQLAQSPAFGHGKAGIADLVVARDGDNPTRLVSDLVKVPYHLPGTLDTDPVDALTTICLQDPTGAVTQGDRQRLSVTARPGSLAHVTTQSATKIQSMKASYAHLDATLVAESGAHLEYIPGQTILNEDARCLQTMTIDLATDATVIVGDIVVPDGLTDHDPFSFDHYHSRVEARVEDSLVCADALDLQPDERDPRDPATVGDHDVIGTLYVLAPAAAVDELADSLHDRLADHDVTAGASVLKADAGVTVRVLGGRSTDVTTAVEAAWDEAREVLLGTGAPVEGRGR
ncbi:MAG: urease accessory protein UreH [Halonotius sp. J07HN6]|nr:MAG: urease accessory protein UreH [Halonotius sp. J07HN6]